VSRTSRPASSAAIPAQRWRLCVMKTSKVQIAILVLLVGVYFLQVATPLRLNPETDTTSLLLIAESAASGSGFLIHGRATVFPPGYPALIMLLMKLHLAHVWMLIGINVVFLIIGLLAVRRLFSSMFSNRFVFGVILLSLLSFVTIKYSALVLTDTVFFGVAMCALVAMQAAEARPTLRNLTVSFGLVIAAICIRRIGVALVPALLWVPIAQSQVRSYIGQRVSGRMAAAIFGSTGLMISWVVYQTSTLSDFTKLFRGHTIIEAASVVWSFRLTELAEITINLPHAALPAMAQQFHVFFFVGAMTLALTLGGIAIRLKQFCALDAFFISYLAVLLVWPYYDPRFWLPVVPLLIAYCGLSLRPAIQNRFTRKALAGYLMMFSVVGLSALTSNTLMSYSDRSTFGDVFPVGSYRSAYCAASYCRDDHPSMIEPDVFHLLKAFR